MLSKVKIPTGGILSRIITGIRPLDGIAMGRPIGFCPTSLSPTVQARRAKLHAWERSCYSLESCAFVAQVSRQFEYGVRNVH